MNQTATETERATLAWHFLRNDGRMRDGTLAEVGKTYRHDGQLKMCEYGYHFSYRALDALKYAPGSVVCRVRVSGEMEFDTDKGVCSERTILAMADATYVLHAFACWCAEESLRAANVTDKRCWNAIATKRRWLKNEATDDELAAASAAARDAAWAAAGAAAWAAAGDAAWAAAWAAAGDAERDAAWANQNAELERRLHELLGTNE